MIIEKNKEYIVDIIDNGCNGEGIAKISNFTVFIPNAIKGEKIKIIIVKVLTSHAFGKIIEILKKSPNRIETDCSTYKRCGGCNLRHIQYEYTLQIKQDIVQNIVNKTLQNKIQVQKTVGMENPYYYRNKVQFPVGINKEGEPQIGLYAKRTHQIIPVNQCMLQNIKAQTIAKKLFEFWVNSNISIYNEQTQKGLLRHIIIKAGAQTGEYMCIMVINGATINSKNGNKEKEIVKFLSDQFPEIKSIVINCNSKNTNVILGEKNKIIYGSEYIKDKLGDFYFKISPSSFYQVNPVQAENLYKLGIKYANISKEDIVFDLYCGIGTISIFMAKYAKKVYGIEIVSEAVKMAKENAIYNKIENVEFLEGDVEKVLQDLIKHKDIIPDVLMIDPPRKGLDRNSIQNILAITPKKIVYISCNPSTLVRDLHMFENYYDIKTIIPIDMFAFTTHVECVAVLNLK